MEFAIVFLRVFFSDLAYATPILIFLLSLIIIMGFSIGKLEKWSTFDALYHAFINATTVGYGDFRPTKKLSRVLAVANALVGLILAGIIVAIAIHSADIAFAIVYDTSGFIDRLRE